MRSIAGVVILAGTGVAMWGKLLWTVDSHSAAIAEMKSDMRDLKAGDERHFKALLLQIRNPDRIVPVDAPDVPR
jgi:hypothetical protein